MKFKYKIYISFSLIFLIFGAFGFLTMWQTKNMANTYSRIKKFDINAIKTIESISRSLLKIRSIEGEILGATNEKIINKDINDINELFKFIKKTITVYKSFTEEGTSLDLINQFDELCDRHMKFNDEFVKEKTSAKNTIETLQSLLNNFRSDYESMQFIIENIKTQELNNLVGKTEKNIVFYDTIIFERIIIFIALSIIGFMLAFYFSEEFSFAFDQVDNRFKTEKLKTNMLNLLRDSVEEIDYPKLLYMISNAVNARFMSVFVQAAADDNIDLRQKSNSFSEFEAFSPVDDDDWKIESFTAVFKHVENVKEPVAYEAASFANGRFGDAAGFNPAQKKFVVNLRPKNINTILIYPILKDSKVIKYYVFYFREAVKFILNSKLDLVGELIREAELLIDNMDLLKELKNKNELLYDQNIELDAYASTVSHDLKNPLNAVFGYYQMLGVKIEKLNAGSALDASSIKELNGFVEKGYRASNMMKNLIEDILAFSHIKVASFKIEKFNVGDALSSVSKIVEEQIKQTGIEFNFPEKLPDIYADKNSIERVFINLVSNAIKYIGQGDHKKINIRWEEEANKHKFTVSDNGIGIARIYQKSIFTPFYRTKENAGAEGTGLGLAITKKIIEKHGGKIWFESSSMEGSSFYFTIPKPAAPALNITSAQ